MRKAIRVILEAFIISALLVVVGMLMRDLLKIESVFNYLLAGYLFSQLARDLTIMYESKT